MNYFDTERGIFTLTGGFQRINNSGSKFADVVLSAMQNQKNYNVLTSDMEKDLVGKTVSQDASKAAVIKRESFGIGFQSKERISMIGKKFVPESRALFFIPIVGPLQVSLGLGPNGNHPVHL